MLREIIQIVNGSIFPVNGLPPKHRDGLANWRSPFPAKPQRSAQPRGRGTGLILRKFGSLRQWTLPAVRKKERTVRIRAALDPA